mmetsp:Transcript_17182/g.37989  ORF Transcript_17182/g.37989 Transcript_17182/m.37989 type:complete len:223 (+) Transcript_17182:478-1146(+)
MEWKPEMSRAGHLPELVPRPRTPREDDEGVGVPHQEALPLLQVVPRRQQEFSAAPPEDRVGTLEPIGAVHYKLFVNDSDDPPPGVRRAGVHRGHAPRRSGAIDAGVSPPREDRAQIVRRVGVPGGSARGRRAVAADAEGTGGASRCCDSLGRPRSDYWRGARAGVRWSVIIGRIVAGHRSGRAGVSVGPGFPSLILILGLLLASSSRRLKSSPISSRGSHLI